MERPGAAESATAYAIGPDGGKFAAAGPEVWLRGNVRPVLGAGAVAVGGAALAAGGAAAAHAGPAVVGTLAAVTALAAGIVAALARVAVEPRLARRGDTLLVRLAPWRTEAVPLEVVECVFPGSQPLAGSALERAANALDDAAPSGRRVGTLVIRFAERAGAWRERPTFAPWGAWHDGHAIVDGRWCEPLTAEVTRALGQRLLEAKRAAAGGARP